MLMILRRYKKIFSDVLLKSELLNIIHELYSTRVATNFYLIIKKLQLFNMFFFSSPEFDTSYKRQMSLTCSITHE